MAIQRPKGTADLLPGNSKKWQYVEEMARMIMRDYQFHEMRTPIFESYDLFSRGVGETSDIVSKEMYDFMADNLAPDEKEILKGMMTRRNDAIETAHSRESFLFYKNGFLDGMGFLLNAVRYM